jgi:hypothetical protein
MYIDTWAAEPLFLSHVNLDVIAGSAPFSEDSSDVLLAYLVESGRVEGHAPGQALLQGSAVACPCS